MRLIVNDGRRKYLTVGKIDNNNYFLVINHPGSLYYKCKEGKTFKISEQDISVLDLDEDLRARYCILGEVEVLTDIA